jgi:hypothetical protein
MTEDQLPLSITDMTQAPEHTGDGSGGKIDRPAPCREDAPAPPPETAGVATDDWRQGGFGSFP